MLHFFDAPHYGVVLVFFVSLFHAVLFLQSGLDKVFDYAGNRAWLEQHFSKSVLAGQIRLLLPALTTLELAAGVVSAAAAGLYFFQEQRGLAALGLSLSALSFIALFFGQRVAKEYAGASTITIYFGVNMLGFVGLSMS